MGLRQILARLGFVFTVARFGGYPCLPGDSVELDLIARVYRRAGARILTLKFCLHSLNHGLPFVWLIACTSARPDTDPEGSALSQALVRRSEPL